MTSGVQEAGQERKPIATAGGLAFNKAAQHDHSIAHRGPNVEDHARATILDRLHGLAGTLWERQCAQHRHLQPNAITLDYSANGKHQRHGVPITQTACHLEGNRPWWLCPRCGRRCAILYGGAVFVCRKCAALHYPTQHSSNVDKAILRAEAIRLRLGWKPGIANPGSGKPKGMHWETFTRLLAQHERYANAAGSWMAARFGL